MSVNQPVPTTRPGEERQELRRKEDEKRRERRKKDEEENEEEVEKEDDEEEEEEKEDKATKKMRNRKYGHHGAKICAPARAGVRMYHPLRGAPLKPRAIIPQNFSLYVRAIEMKGKCALL